MGNLLDCVMYAIAGHTIGVWIREFILTIYG